MKPADRWVVPAICLLLAGMTWLVFAQTLQHAFINYDDGQYVYKNPQVTPGLTRAGIIWAFTHTYAANWHPLTWLSHMTDCQLFGLWAGGHHLTNIVLHGATAILLFLVLRRMTASLWRSAVLAALFAIHPLRVESVAWVAERKDLLSGLFFVLTIGAYVRYARTPSAGRYALMALLFALGLMCKPMLVTVPFVLLLLDYWPLNRFAAEPGNSNTGVPLRRLIAEKLPLLAMAGASAVVTLFAQTVALQPLANISVPQRFGNAVMSVATYIGQMFWPSGLVPIYPLDAGKIVLVQVVFSLVVLAGISAVAFWLRRRRYLVTGWAWYLIMLVPVIGIVQVGNQAHADRYTYLPQMGLGLALTWGAADLAASWRYSRLALSMLASVIIAVLAFSARKQASYWRDSETLWNHTLACTSNNVIAEQDLGQVLHDKGRSLEAIAHFERALAINPNQASVHSSLGVVLLEMGRPAESLRHLETSITQDPNDGDAHYNLANTLMAIGRDKDAVSHYRRALERDPLDTQAMNNLAWLLATAPDPSTRDGKKAVELAEGAYSLTRGTSPQTGATLAAAYAEVGRIDEAIATAHRALALASKAGNTALAEMIRAHIQVYESGSPFRTSRDSRLTP